jgi:Rad3-related DNA helicase
MKIYGVDKESNGKKRWPRRRPCPPRAKNKEMWDACEATRYYQRARWAIRIAQVVITLHRLFYHHW